MKLSKIRQIIKEELQRFANESMWDDYYAKIGVDPTQRYPDESKPEPQTQQQPIKSTKGELVGRITTSWGRKMDKPVAVYKNPQLLTGFDIGVAGALVAKNLDLYLTENRNGMHQDLMIFLSEHGIIPQSSLAIDGKGIPKYFETYPPEFVAVFRVGNSDIIAQSHMYDTYSPTYGKMLKDASNKFKGLRFTKSPSIRTGR